jgi:hypothetical protein
MTNERGCGKQKEGKPVDKKPSPGQRLFDAIEAMPGVDVTEVEDGTHEKLEIEFRNPWRHLRFEIKVTRLSDKYVDGFLATTSLPFREGLIERARLMEAES